MTLVQKLTKALLLFKGLNDCFVTNNHNEFTKLKMELIEAGVEEEDFDSLMNTIFDN